MSMGGMGMGGGMPPMGGMGGGMPPEQEMGGADSPLLMALMQMMGGQGGGMGGSPLGMDPSQPDPSMGLEQMLQMLAMSQGGMGGTDPSLQGGGMPGGSGVPMGMPGQGMGMGGYC